MAIQVYGQTQPSALSSFYNRTMQRAGSGQGFTGGLDRIKTHVMEGGEAVRQSGESLVVGGALAMAHVHLKTGLDLGTKKIPLDAAAGVMGVLAGIALANDEGGTDLRNAGAAALSVFAFRKTFDWAAKKKAATGGGAPGGTLTKVAGESDYGADMGEDPIIRAAMAL